MEHTAPDPRAERQQKMAKETARKLAREIWDYVRENPILAQGSILFPDPGHGTWILRFLNTELAKRGLYAEFYWENGKRSLKIMKGNAEHARTQEQQSFPHFTLAVAIFLIVFIFLSLSGGS